MKNFHKLELDVRKKLIGLYEKYIDKPSNPKLEELAIECCWDASTPILSKLVNQGGRGACKIITQELSLSDAIQILNALKKGLLHEEANILN